MSCILTVILDSNILMAPGKFGIDIFEELERVIEKGYELVVPEPVEWELKNISKGRKDRSKAARIGLVLMEKNGVKVKKTKNRTGDAAIVELARISENPVVCTNDRELKRQFRKRSVPVICVRTKDHLELVGRIV